MEYLEGADLAQLLATEGPLGEPAAIDWLLEACEAVAEAHAAGIVHRDLKPENLFLARRPGGGVVIKVLDFGISKTTGPANEARALTNPSSALGSPHFMAPEQMRAPHDVDERADIWALGAILYELLTGVSAFEGADVPAVCAAVLHTNPIPVRELVPEITPAVEHAIDRCLRKDREERFATVAEFATAVAPFGSARARSSLAVIGRLLGDEPTWPATPVITQHGALPEPIELAATVKRIDAASSGSFTPVDPDFPHRRRVAWLLGLTAPGLALAVAFGVALRSSGKSPARAEPRTAAPSAAPARSAPIVLPALEAPIAAEPIATTRAVSKLPSRPRTLPPPRRAANPSPAPDGSAEPPGPWNPESFGGRR
jgi:serine/threonine-protein kinase